MTHLLSMPPVADSAMYSSGSYASANLGDQLGHFLGSTTFVKGLMHCRYIARFDLSGVPPRSAILAVRLTITKLGGAYPNGTIFRAHRVARHDWTELGVTWNRYNGADDWTTPGGDFDPSLMAETSIDQADSKLVFPNLASLATDAILFRDGLLDLLVLGREQSGGEYLSIDSANAEEPERWPELEIEYVLPPLLTIADHGDGSGATFSLADLDPEAHAVLHVRAFSGDLGTESWTTAGMFDASGELTLSLVPGHYLAYAVATVNAAQVTSAVTYFIVTDGLESIHTRCLSAVQARIRLLELEGVSSERVLIEKVPAGRNLSAAAGLPAIVISPQRAAMPADAGTNGTDDVHYDVQVSIFDRDNQEPTLAANLDRHLLWRQQIARVFRNQRLPGVPEVINSAVEPTDGPHEGAWKHELMTTAIRLRFTSREPRGF